MIDKIRQVIASRLNRIRIQAAENRGEPRPGRSSLIYHALAQVNITAYTYAG